MKILTTTELQKNIGKISTHTEKSSVIITSRGKAKYIILPYFDDHEEVIANYWETYEMQKNKKNLQKKYEKSLSSELSSFKI